jgi:hypothetical protein
MYEHKIILHRPVEKTATFQGHKEELFCRNLIMKTINLADSKRSTLAST